VYSFIVISVIVYYCL